jgi:phosphohistidine phosphatase SixA
MRHAHSQDGPQMDPDRTITSKGKEQIKAMRKFLKDAGVLKKIDCVLTSHFERAADTVEELDEDFTSVYCRELEPDGVPDKAWAKVRKVADTVDAKHILIVTHDPLIQPMLAAVCFQFSERNIFDHANIAHFDSDGTFHWFMTPKLAEKLRESDSLKTPTVRVAEAAEELTEALRLR